MAEKQYIVRISVGREAFDDEDSLFIDDGSYDAWQDFKDEATAAAHPDEDVEFFLIHALTLESDSPISVNHYFAN